MNKFKLPNLVTYIGAASSVTAMILAFNQKINFAMICLIISGISDLFDGKFARGFKRTDTEKLVGIELDSLSDVTNFLICPVVICLGMGFHGWISYIVFVLYVLAGITRLAVFNVGAAENNVDTPVTRYNGLPVTYAAVLFPFFWLFSRVLDDSAFQILYTIVMLIIAYLFVSNIKIPKPKGIALPIFSVAAIIMTVVLIIL